MYAKRIRKLQRELGLEITDFKILHLNVNSDYNQHHQIIRIFFVFIF